MKKSIPVCTVVIVLSVCAIRRSATAETNCLNGEVIELLDNGYRGRTSTETEANAARVAIQKIPRDCLPSLIATINSTNTTDRDKAYAMIAVGILGMVGDASSAVPTLTNINAVV